MTTPKAEKPPEPVTDKKWILHLRSGDYLCSNELGWLLKQMRDGDRLAGGRARKKGGS